MDANSTVAVVYSGRLGVVVPEAGALARRFLIDPLRASVFVAGQHGSSVTGGHNWVGASAHACPGPPSSWPASTRLCRDQGGAAIRPTGAPVEATLSASSRLKLRPASASQLLGPRWPATTSVALSTQQPL